MLILVGMADQKRLMQCRYWAEMTRSYQTRAMQNGSCNAPL